MKILKSWLQDYLSVDVSDERLEEILTLAGIEVESVEKSLDDNVVVVGIKSIAKHPNADKLSLVEVSDGSEVIRVVCGAKNIEVGQIVPLAKPGAIIKGALLKEANIRGENSFGMLCAADELGIGDDHSGIYILPDDYKVGSKLNDYLASDTIFEISPTANRGDCLSHVGVAREIAAYENSQIRKEPVKLSKSDSQPTKTQVEVEIKKSELCPQYLARVIKDVKIAPSPKWLQDRLIACGAKPINNVVDVTNYILLDLGHPMHAFDQKKISENKIIVRQAKKNEDIVTLDGEVRNLSNEMLVIADKDKAVALAGIMGGQNSEVDENTETIVLEAAEFDRKNIRATAKELKISTEASYRFERGIDSGGIEFAINKAADLIANVAGGKVMSGIVSVGDRPQRLEIKIEQEKIRSLLGISVSNDEIDHILRLLGFTITGDLCQVPLWRHDIFLWQDLAEEIGRVLGYDKIQKLDLGKIEKFEKTGFYRTEEMKDHLAAAGYSETMNYPFMSEADLADSKLEASGLLEIANPLQSENRYLRNSLVPGLLKNVAKNPAFDQVNLFEIGHTFGKTKETQNLGIISTSEDRQEFDKFVEEFSKFFSIQTKLFKIKYYQREDLASYKIKRPKVSVAEIDLSKAFENKKVDQSLKINPTKETIVYRGVSKYPSLTRDLAFIVDKKVKSDELSHDIYASSDLINRVELFDEFASDKFGVGKKNLAYHISLQAYDRTLKDDEAEKIIATLVNSIEKKFKARLRKG